MEMSAEEAGPLKVREQTSSSRRKSATVPERRCCWRRNSAISRRATRSSGGVSHAGLREPEAEDSVGVEENQSGWLRVSPVMAKKRTRAQLAKEM